MKVPSNPNPTRQDPNPKCQTLTEASAQRVLSESRVREREFFIDNLLVRIHLIIVIIRWTGLAPWEFESHFPGSLESTSLS